MLRGFADKSSFYTADKINFDLVRHRDGAVFGFLEPKHANQVNIKERLVVIIADNQKWVVSCSSCTGDVSANWTNSSMITGRSLLDTGFLRVSGPLCNWSRTPPKNVVAISFSFRQRPKPQIDPGRLAPPL
jgi:hypothetical protein